MSELVEVAAESPRVESESWVSRPYGELCSIETTERERSAVEEEGRGRKGKGREGEGKGKAEGRTSNEFKYPHNLDKLLRGNAPMT